MSDFVSGHRDLVYGETLQDKLHGLLSQTPWWAISLVLHVGFMIFAYNYQWKTPRPKPTPKMNTKMVKDPKVKEYQEQQYKPKDIQKETTETVRRQIDRPDVRQNDLPDVDIDMSDTNHHQAVLTVPGGVARAGAIGGGGFQVASGTRGAMGVVSGWPGWQDRCLAVWLFDESKSMKDDQQVVRQKVDELYTDLGINMADSRQSRRILTVVCSYGEKFNVILGKPTNEMAKIKEAIDKVPVDKSGKENYLTAINGVLSKFSSYPRKYGRNIVIILVTDEGGDDDLLPAKGKKSLLEATLDRMKKMKAHLLVFGAEAGEFNYAQEQTYDPTVPKGVSPYAYVNRGLDTGFGEMIPHDWYFRRTRRVPSGFGAYGMHRLCVKTGGVYYLLRDARAIAYDYEKLLAGYRPEIASRTDIAKRNSRNKLRRTIMEIVIGWEKIRGEPGSRRFSSYYQNSAAGKQRMQSTMKVVNDWLRLLNKSIKELEGLSNVNVKNSPKRWEANRDLMWAMVHKLRFQLIQYKLALDDLMHGRNLPPAGDIGWHISWHRNPVLRTTNEKLLARLHEERGKIEKMFQTVIDRHAGTPWEEFAKREMRQMRGYAIHPWSRSRSSGVTHENR